MASTAMPDVAAMTCVILGFERLLAWRDTRRWHAAIAAALAFALAILARSHSALLLPLAAMLLPAQPGRLAEWRRLPAMLWTPLIAAPILALLVALVMRDPLAPAASTAFATMRYSGWSFFVSNLVAFCTHWTLVLPLAIPWFALRWRVILKGPAVYLLTAAAAWILADTQPAVRLWPIAAAAGLGARVIADILIDARRRRDTTQLFLGLVLLAPLPVALYLHFPSKYLLVSAPASAILIARALGLRAAPIAHRATAGIVAAGLLLGVAIIRTDAAFADLGRRATQDFIVPNVAAGRTVWFAGHWGFQWYAE